MRFNAMYCIARSDRRSSLRLENLNKLLYYLSTLLRWIERILVILTFNLFISACSDGAIPQSRQIQTHVPDPQFSTLLCMED